MLSGLKLEVEIHTSVIVGGSKVDFTLMYMAPCSSPLYTILFLLASTEDVLILLIIDAWPMRTCFSANSTVALNKLRACCLTCD